MDEPPYTDEENPSDRLYEKSASLKARGGTSSPAISVADEEDLKKIEFYHEMAQVHHLTRRIYYQCLILLVVIGIGLVVFATQSPFKSLAPLANDILCIIGIVVFIILSFFAVTCGSANAQTKLILIIMISIFLGLSCGFLVALNVTVKSRAPLYNSNFDPF